VAQVVYYLTPQSKNPVKEFIDSLSDKQKSKIFRIFSLIEEYGLCLAIPHIKKITGTPLWEIRILGRDNIRIIYVSVKNNRVLVLNGFVKKSQKIPEKEINIAMKRYQDWLLTNDIL